MKYLSLAAALLAMAIPADAAVTGKVSLAGEPPPESTIKMNADPKCEELHSDPVTTEYFVIGDDGGLANVFVYIENPPAGEHEPPEEAVVLGQHGCLYEPQVAGILVDQTLEIHNEDDILHNVRALARTNRPFNLGQPGVGVREKTFKLPELAVRMKCDVHPWMESHLFVMDHPFFAVSGGDGSFEIAGLPSGSYTLVAWHSRLGEQRSTITVDEHGGTTADVQFTVE